MRATCSRACLAIPIPHTSRRWRQKLCTVDPSNSSIQRYSDLLFESTRVSKGRSPKKLKPTILEELQQTNSEIEKFLATFTEANIDFFVLENPLRKEYIEPCSVATIMLYSREMKTLKLSLRNMSLGVNAAACPNPYVEQGQTLRQDKGKSTILNQLPNPTNSTNFIIWNTGGTNNASFKC